MNHWIYLKNLWTVVACGITKYIGLQLIKYLHCVQILSIKFESKSNDSFF